ncbi:MAG: hypothetical protein ABIH77_05835 [Pseudomonadota bacterium]
MTLIKPQLRYGTNLDSRLRGNDEDWISSAAGYDDTVAAEQRLKLVAGFRGASIERRGLL